MSREVDSQVNQTSPVRPRSRESRRPRLESSESDCRPTESASNVSKQRAILPPHTLLRSHADEHLYRVGGDGDDIVDTDGCGVMNYRLARDIVYPGPVSAAGRLNSSNTTEKAAVCVSLVKNVMRPRLTWLEEMKGVKISQSGPITTSLFDLQDAEASYCDTFERADLYKLPIPDAQKTTESSNDMNQATVHNAEGITLFGKNCLRHVSASLVDEGKEDNLCLFTECNYWTGETRLAEIGKAPNNSTNLESPACIDAASPRISYGAHYLSLKTQVTQSDGQSTRVATLLRVALGEDQMLGSGGFGGVFPGWLTPEGRDVFGYHWNYASKEPVPPPGSDLAVAVKLEDLLEDDELDEARLYSHNNYCKLRYMELTRRRHRELSAEGLLRIYAEILVDERLKNADEGGEPHTAGMKMTIMERAPESAFCLRKILYKPKDGAAIGSDETNKKLDLGRENLSFLLLKEIFARLMACVERLQELELLHFDIKPDNFMVSIEESKVSVYLLDYDFICTAQQYHEFGSIHKNVPGTSVYCSPDRFMAEWCLSDEVQTTKYVSDHPNKTLSHLSMVFPNHMPELALKQDLWVYM